MFMTRSFTYACEDYWIYDLESGLYIREDGTLGSCCPKFFKTEQEAQDFLNKWLPKGHWVFNCYLETGLYSRKFYKVDWLTPEHIQEQAKLGDKEALDCSIEHWKQIVVAGFDEFIKARKADGVNIGSFHCALCRRNRLFTEHGCGDTCLIYRKLKSSCSYDTPYRKVSGAFDKQDKQAFESAAVEELNFLIELRNELFGNPYSTTELETEKMSDKMIVVKGKKISENTIVEALHNQFGFFPDKPKQYAVEVRKYHGRPRVMIRLPDWVIKKIRKDDIRSFVLDPEMLEGTTNWSLDRNEDYTKDDYLSKQIEFSIGEIKG
jgi:hypothetical protein